MSVPPQSPYEPPQWSAPSGQYPPPYPYPYPYPYGYPPAPQGTNAMAIASLVCAFLFAPLGIVFGHISLSQIRKTGEQGHGLAVAGLVLSYLMTAVTVVSVIAMFVFFNWALRDWDHFDPDWDQNPTYSADPFPQTSLDELPAFAPPVGLGAACTYPAGGAMPKRPVTPPRAGKVPTDPATVDATVTTNLGAIGLSLDNAKAPCTVNNFVSLAEQGYYDGTGCHRLSASNALSMLQCGDPTGSGLGGPGYQFDNEYPTNQYQPDDPDLDVAVRYPRGTLAMANAGPDTNGSQFFVVYQDSALPPTYTVFGRIDNTGMEVVDQVAEAGVQGGNIDGKPQQAITIQSIRLD